MVDVFISYSRADQAKVAVLARAVEAAGYEVWWDAELPPHQSYGDVITDKIAGAKAAIVVWSPTAVKSEWVRAEADMARNQRKLIQTALDQVVPPLPFNQIQYAEIGDWRGEDDHPAWNKVKLSLATLCGGREGEAATRTAVPPPHARQSQPPPQAISRWPLYAGIAVALFGLAAAGGVLLGRGSNSPDPATALSATAPNATPASTASPPAVAQVSPEEEDDTATLSPAEPVAPSAPTQAAEDALPRPDPADMTFPDSSTRLLTQSEVMALGPASLRVARNEIYARKGRRFKAAWLRDWFGRYSWYRPLHDEVRLNVIERRNIELIIQAEQRYR